MPHESVQPQASRDASSHSHSGPRLIHRQDRVSDPPVSGEREVVRDNGDQRVLEAEEWSHSIPPPDPELMREPEMLSDEPERLVTELREIRQDLRLTMRALEELQGPLRERYDASFQAGTELTAAQFTYEGADGLMHPGEDVLNYDITQFAKKYRIPGLLDERGRLPFSKKTRRLTIDDLLYRQRMISSDPVLLETADRLLGEYRLAVQAVAPLEKAVEETYRAFRPLEQQAQQLQAQITELEAKERRRMEKYRYLQRMARQERDERQSREQKRTLFSSENLERLARALETARTPDQPLDLEADAALRRFLQAYEQDKNLGEIFVSATGERFDPDEVEQTAEHLLDTTYIDIKRASQKRRDENRQQHYQELCTPNSLKNLTIALETLRSSPHATLNHRIERSLQKFVNEYTQDPQIVDELVSRLRPQFSRGDLERLFETSAKARYRKAA